MREKRIEESDHDMTVISNDSAERTAVQYSASIQDKKVKS